MSSAVAIEWTIKETWHSIDVAEMFERLEHGGHMMYNNTQSHVSVHIKFAFDVQLQKCIEIKLIGREAAYRNDQVNKISAVFYRDSLSRENLLAFHTLFLPKNKSKSILYPKAVFAGAQKILFMIRTESGTSASLKFSPISTETDRSNLIPHSEPDVKILIKGRNDIYAAAHKSVLMASSPVFAAMFQSQMLETQTNSVTIVSDCSADTLKTFLAYLYRPTINWHNRNDVDKISNRFIVSASPNASASASSSTSSSASFATSSTSLVEKEKAVENQKQKEEKDEDKEDAEAVETTAEAEDSLPQLPLPNSFSSFSFRDRDVGLFSKKSKVVAKKRKIEHVADNDDAEEREPQNKKEKRENGSELVLPTRFAVAKKIDLPLLALANYFQVESLIRRIESDMLQSLYTESVELYYSTAILYDLTRLKGACSAFISDMLSEHMSKQRVIQQRDNEWHAKLLQFVGPFLASHAAAKAEEKAEEEEKEKNELKPEDFLESDAALAAALAAEDENDNGADTNADYEETAAEEEVEEE